MVVAHSAPCPSALALHTAQLPCHAHDREHFDLDLDLPIPEHVNEQVILDAVKAHGTRGGEMGSCLRHCVPAARRYFDAQIGLSNSVRDEHLALVQLYKALGGGWTE